MHSIFNAWLKACTLFAMMLFAQLAVAADQSPEAVVQRVSDEMMAIIKTGDKALEQNPDAYFGQLEAVLEDTVHFPYISRYVMGPYWDGASGEQRNAFVKRFKRSMVETIGKGLANYSDLELRILPSDGPSKKNVAIVKQEVAGAKQPVTIAYWMARNKDGQWKLIDVVLDGVKLRQTFRSQFASEMNKYQNDYDKVIANWNAAEQTS